jgi:hypothetical protein
MLSGDTLVDRDYQRSSKVWPPAARSFLIDTILLGYPMPKISLYQQTDLKTKKTTNHIVDGQQRSTAILDFYNDKLRITGKSDFAGKTYSQLEKEQQQAFMEYALSIDIFVGATPENIREVFRRMNSYTVPLNHQEKRHATYQGDFKWFILGESKTYSEPLKKMGVLSERQLSRMQEGQLLSEIALAILNGIETWSQAKLETLYRSKDDAFPEQDDLDRRFKKTFGHLLEWEPIHGTTIMKQFAFYSLFLAVAHQTHKVPALEPVYRSSRIKTFDRARVLANLSVLAEALEADGGDRKFASFVKASQSATNTKENREARFEWFCKALEPRPL